jgi:hypothetical protein
MEDNKKPLSKGRSANSNQKEPPTVDAAMILPPPPAKKQILKPLKLNNLDDVYKFGKTLKKYITDNKLSCTIQGREYAYVDGWKFALINFGIVPIVEEPVRMDAGKLAQIFSAYVEVTNKWGKKERILKTYFAGINEELAKRSKEKKAPDHELFVDYFSYKCSCNLKSIATGEIIGAGYAICTNIESKKTSFDEYSVASMSQTRAIGKAARNLIGFIMNAAGIEGTPAEEMEPLVDGMPPVGDPLDKPEPANVEDFTDMKIAINDCRTLQALEEIWVKNSNLHTNNIFKSLIFTRKKQITELVKKPQ